MKSGICFDFAFEFNFNCTIHYVKDYPESITNTVTKIIFPKLLNFFTGCMHFTIKSLRKNTKKLELYQTQSFQSIIITK